MGWFKNDLPKAISTKSYLEGGIGKTIYRASYQDIFWQKFPNLYKQPFPELHALSIDFEFLRPPARLLMKILWRKEKMVRASNFPVFQKCGWLPYVQIV